MVTPYFASPRQWTIKFILARGGQSQPGIAATGGENPYLPKIQRSVISSFMINHDPDSVISFHRDGSPVHSTLTLTFKEIVHVTSDDEVSDVFQAEAKKLGKANFQAIGGINTTPTGDQTETREN